MNYSEMHYRDLKVLCAERQLGGAGTKDQLLKKLLNADAGNDPEPFQPVDRAGKPLAKDFKLHDTNPDSPNYDMAGRWIRRRGNIRPDGAVCEGGWGDENVIEWPEGMGPK